MTLYERVQRSVDDLLKDFLESFPEKKFTLAHLDELEYRADLCMRDYTPEIEDFSVAVRRIAKDFATDEFKSVYLQVSFRCGDATSRLIANQPKEQKL